MTLDLQPFGNIIDLSINNLRPSLWMVLEKSIIRAILTTIENLPRHLFGYHVTPKCECKTPLKKTYSSL